MTDNHRRTGPVDVLVLAASAGLLLGLIEVATLYARLGLGGRIGVSRDFTWMAPAADLFLFLVGGGVLAVASLLSRGRLPYWVGAAAVGIAFGAGLVLLFPRIHSVARLIVLVGIAVQLGRFAAARPDLLRRRALRALPVLAVLALVIGSLGPLTRSLEGRSLADHSVAVSPDAPNIVLVVLDAVRAASVSAHGYARRTTPHLERLAAEGVRFDRAISTAPWTLPAHATLFTGRYPHELSASWKTPLDASDPTLAEVLATHGYATAGFTGNFFYTTWETGVHRGFAHYDDYGVTTGQLLLSTSLGRRLALDQRLRDLFGYYDNVNRRSAAEINDAFMGWLDDAPADRPFFAFLNYFDAHEPYLPEDPYRDMHGSDHLRRNELIRFAAPLGIGYRMFKHEMSPAERQAELDAYEETITYMDAQIARLVEELDSRGLLQNTVVVVTADHGEQFGEHDLFEHANSLYMPLVHVPLVIHGARGWPAGSRVTTAATLRDLPATLLEFAGIDGEPLPGMSLSRHWAGVDAAAATSPILSSVRARDRLEPQVDVHSLIEWPYHLISRADGGVELYDLVVDPDQLVDRSESPDARPALVRLSRTLSGATDAADPELALPVPGSE